MSGHLLSIPYCKVHSFIRLFVSFSLNRMFQSFECFHIVSCKFSLLSSKFCYVLCVYFARVYNLCSIFHYRAQVMNGIDRAVAFAAYCFFTVCKMVNTIIVEPATEQSDWFLISPEKPDWRYLEISNIGGVPS